MNHREQSRAEARICDGEAGFSDGATGFCDGEEQTADELNRRERPESFVTS